MKPIVDRDLCIGCGACEEECPEVFELKEDGISSVIKEHPGRESYGCVHDAADACPVDAIHIEE